MPAPPASQYTPGEKAPIIPFSNLNIALTDFFHDLVLVEAGFLFDRNKPGHLVYCELARLSRSGYLLVVSKYHENSTQSFEFLEQLYESVTSFFSGSREPYEIDPCLSSLLRWMPNNTVWLQDKTQGSNHRDTLVTCLLFSCQQTLASMFGNSPVAVSVQKMKRPIRFTDSLQKQFPSFVNEDFQKTASKEVDLHLVMVSPRYAACLLLTRRRCFGRNAHWGRIFCSTQRNHALSQKRRRMSCQLKPAAESGGQLSSIMCRFLRTENSLMSFRAPCSSVPVAPHLFILQALL